jgi:hypothetical protein
LEPFFGRFWTCHAFIIHPGAWPSAMRVDLFDTYPYDVDGFELALAVLALFAAEAKLFSASFSPISTMGKNCFQYGRRTVAVKNNLKKHFLDNVLKLALAKNWLDRCDA